MCTTKIIDEAFSYDQRGLMNAYYQASPNSNGYYALSAAHWEDTALKTVSGVGLPTLTYGGLDGEGRVTSVSASAGTNPVSNVYYNITNGDGDSIGNLLTATLGTGDTQSFTYDKNTGRMTQYSASVGSSPTVISDSLHWNANGTLQWNNIADQYNAADTQDCTYLYDDFMRAPSVNCLNGSTKVWVQSFTYGTDAFGNLTKSSSGPGLTWNPGYNSANNQYTLQGTNYDSDGNLKTDTFHTYTWLADGHVASVDSSTITYDALGNKVEEDVSGVVHEYVSAFGVDAQMSGQTEAATNVDLPGSMQALYSGGTLQRFRFPDWQGTIRAESNPSTRQFTESLAFAPFGERYAVAGAPYNVDSFTGKPDQITSDEYDFEARELHNVQGRWISPDPVSGTGNKYAYADNNPLSKVDSYGLVGICMEGMDVPASDEGLDSAASNEEYGESHPPDSASTGGETPSTSPNGGGPPPSSGSPTPGQTPAPPPQAPPTQQPAGQQPSPADQAKDPAQQNNPTNAQIRTELTSLASSYGVPANVVLAVAKTESNFNVDAVNDNLNSKGQVTSTD